MLPDKEDLVHGLLPPGGVDAASVAQGSHALGLVQQKIVLYPAPEVPGHHPGEPGKGLGGLRIQPAVPVLQGLGQLPVVEGHIGRNARLQAEIDQAVIVGKALFIPISVPFRVDSGPGGGEAVSGKAHVLQIFNVPFRVGIAAAGGVAGIALKGLAGGVGEGIPDGFSSAVGQGISLNLVGTGGSAPDEIFWKFVHPKVTSTVTLLPAGAMGSTLPVMGLPSTVTAATPF